MVSFNFLGSCDLTEIGTNAFANCTKLKTFNFPKNVTTIGRNAFSGCSSMSQVTFALDADIVAFGAGAFADCGLTSIDIPKRVSSIDREAFRNCKVLTEVNVPAITTHVSPEAFKFCDKLTDIKVDKGNNKYSSLDGILLTKDKQTLVLFPPGKANDKFTLLPPSITTIGEYSFYECLALKNVTIPNKVTKIGKRAFGLCKNLHTVTFLCDQMIKPVDIVQGQNDMAFDDGSQAPKMFDNIDIHVRKSLLDQYKGETFYKQFKSISPSFIDGDGEYIPVSPTDADLLSTTTTDYTYVVPTTAKNGTTSYAVSLVGDYLFQGKANDKVKEVVVKDNVKYIGARAFVNDLATSASTVEHVFFIGTTPTGDMLSTVRFELDETGTNYNEFSPQAKVFVKKSAEAGYKAAWAKYANQIDYRIPDVKIAKKYGTFAREFDTDFSDYFATNHNTKVAAFVAGSNILPGGGDYGTSTYHVKMWSIDVKGGVNGNYGYVPAYTGVLLKVLDKESTPADFYYTIGEQDNRTYNISDNIMHGITVRNERVEASATEPVYVMQGGVFRKATADIGSFSVHKAYMKPGTLPAGAKVMLVFDDAEGSATGIETVVETGARKEDNVYYNLNGQRVDNPRHGVYIRNGKKVIIK
ncbi:leucine-rich repeat domain-containing protein [Prevotella sp. HUN102]|uniref:leucine-rich repeat domain-containing protein n=1 Tax=Prevotella sp. HUN102 TaxID=1392486 RepID=UPI00350F745F